MSRLALITYLDGRGDQPVDPGYGVSAPPAYPSQGLPSAPGHPSQGLPGLPPGAVTLPVFPWDPTIDNSLPGSGGRPDNSLPGGGGRPDNSLPGSGGRPDNSLPSPGRRYVVKWLACVGLILVPDNELPETPEPK